MTRRYLGAIGCIFVAFLAHAAGYSGEAFVCIAIAYHLLGSTSDASPR